MMTYRTEYRILKKPLYWGGGDCIQNKSAMGKQSEIVVKKFAKTEKIGNNEV